MTMNKKKQMAIGALIHANGSHSASWLLQEAHPHASTDIDYYRGIAQLAERGKFDFFFIADTPAARTENLRVWSRSPLFMNVLEPITLLSAVAGATTHIGLGATASTSFFEPYNLARQFASLDHISHGRAAWNVVTSANDYAARNFGLDRLPPHSERYAKAREFVEVVEALWDTWEDGAFVYDRDACLSFLPEKFHGLEHKGKYFTVQGALNIERSPQGRPVIIQAGASDTGRDFAAETAEVVFGSGASLEEGGASSSDLRSGSAAGTGPRTSAPSAVSRVPSRASIAARRAWVCLPCSSASSSSSRWRSLKCFSVKTSATGMPRQISAPRTGTSPLTRIASAAVEAGSMPTYLSGPGGCEQARYQTAHFFSGFIGDPALQENALAKSALSETGPFTRHWAVEWGLVCACSRAASGR